MPDLQAEETLGSATDSLKKKTRLKKNPSNGSQKDWTIKGLPLESVEIARDAARDSGMKINAWVAQVFADAGKGKLPRRLHVETESSGAEIDIDDELKILRIQNDKLVQTINNLSAAIAKMCQ